MIPYKTTNQGEIIITEVIRAAIWGRDNGIKGRSFCWKFRQSLVDIFNHCITSSQRNWVELVELEHQQKKNMSRKGLHPSHFRKFAMGFLMENSIPKGFRGSILSRQETISCSLLMDKTWVMPRNYPQKGGQKTDLRQRLLILFKLGWFGDSNSSWDKTHKSILPLNAKKSLAVRRTLGLLSTVRTLLWTIKRPQQSGGFNIFHCLNNKKVLPPKKWGSNELKKKHIL